MMNMTAPQPSNLPSWPEIRELYPDLANRLREGDLSSRVEFVMLALGGTIIEVRHADGQIERPETT